MSTEHEYEIGCYFNGAFGFEHNAQRIIDFAMDEHNYVPDYEAEDGDHFEALCWEVESVEEFLNEVTKRPEGSFWCWSDGDFGLWFACTHCGELNDENKCYICEEE